MTRVKNLTSDKLEFDDIKAKEAGREPVKVTLKLSPVTEFIIENIQHKLHTNRTSATSELLDAAALDWLEAKGYSTESEEFLEKYRSWLYEAHLGKEEVVDHGAHGEPIVGRQTHWGDEVAL